VKKCSPETDKTKGRHADCLPVFLVVVVVGEREFGSKQTIKQGSLVRQQAFERIKQVRTLSSCEMNSHSLVTVDGLSSRASRLSGEPSRSHELLFPDDQRCQYIAIRRHSTLEDSSVQRDTTSHRLSADTCVISDSILHFDGVETVRIGMGALSPVPFDFDVCSCSSYLLIIFVRRNRIIHRFDCQPLQLQGPELNSNQRTNHSHWTTPNSMYSTHLKMYTVPERSAETIMPNGYSSKATAVTVSLCPLSN
jgi:hypothetical protein